MSAQVQPWLTEPLLQESGTAPSTTALSSDRKPVSRRRHPQTTDKTQLSESKKRCIEVAAIYIEDAIHVRKPQTRIQEKGIDFKIWNRRIILSPLKAYKFVHNKWWKIFLYFVIWTHLLCVIWEPKHSSATDIDDFNTINTWILMIQLLCLMIFILDCALKLFSHDREFWRNPWQRLLYCVIMFNTIHVILSFMGHFIPQNVSLCLQIVRPYYLIYNARSLRSVIRGVVRSVPRIMVLVWVIAFTVCCFGLIGYELFYHCPTFHTFEESMLSLMVLLTTANYPDVMMCAYHGSQFSVIFFACFVIIILVLFLPTLLAVIYEGYHSQTQKRYSEITKIHKEALLRSFELLTCENDSRLLFASMNESFGTSVNGNGSNLVVTKEIWMQFMRIVRPDLDVIKQEVLYTTLRLTEEDLSCLPNVVEYKLNSPETADGITQQQFLRLPEFIEIKFHISRKAGIAHALVTLQNRIRRMETQTFGNRIKSCETKIRVYLLYIFSHPLSEAIIDWMVWINAVTFIAEKCADEVHNDQNGTTIFRAIHVTFLVIFVWEIVLKMYAFGWRAFLSDKFFIFDTILVAAGIIGWVKSNDSDSYVQLIRALRLLRVLKEFPQMRLLVLFLSSLLRSFVILLLAQFCVFYVFAMIGMAMFDGLLGYEQIKTEMSKCDPSSADFTYWRNHLTDEDATHRYYYLNNMNSFINSMIVLMELSVVNNWQVVMAMYIKMSQNHYNRIFFIAFYFCSVIVVLNVVIAFVINLFLVNYGQNISSNDLLFRYKRYIIMSILVHQLNDNEYDIYHWNIERRIRPALWYQIIFEDKLNNSIENVNAAQMFGQGEIDNSIDYDDAIQMPFAQGTLIEQFQSFGTGDLTPTRHTAYTPKMGGFGTPEKTGNIFLNQSLTDMALFSSLHSTYHRNNSLGKNDQPPAQHIEHRHLTLSSRHKS